VNISDEELMLEYGKGADWAFELLVERYQRPLINFFYRALKERSQAEDLAQEVFIGLFRAAKRYKATAKFTTFMFRIASNLLASEVRKRVRRPRTVPIVERTSSDGEDVRVTQIEDKEARVDNEVDLHILAESIRDAVAALPNAQRTVFELRKYQGLSYQEIAGVMRCPVGTVKSRMARAERALRPKLKEVKDELT
jgi:RNA polymerase sigma-70 factor (ECF subfamily)